MVGSALVLCQSSMTGIWAQHIVGAEVLEYFAKNCSIDKDRIYVSAYSFGSAMAWRYVCENGNDVAALLAISRALRQDVQCPQAPHEVRHVYGTDDTVMDFPFGTGVDTTYPVKLWRDKFDCGVGQDAGAWNVVDFLTFQRTTWVDWGSDQNVTLDIYPGGHFIPHGWIGRQLDELL